MQREVGGSIPPASIGLTVSPPARPDLDLLERPGPPFVDEESMRQLDTIVAKGMAGAASRDDSGNHVPMTQRVETGIAPPG